MSEWKSIETAPKTGEHLLLCDLQGSQMMVGWWDDDPQMREYPWATIDDHLPRYVPTHWRPLPDFPRA